MATADDLTLEAVVDALVEDPDYASGARPAPRRVSAVEALRVLDDIFEGCNQSDQLIPGIAQQLGRDIACERQCRGGCCEQIVLITVPEGMAVAAELGKPERVEERERYVAQLRAWREQFGARAEDGAHALAEGRIDDYQRIQHEHAAELAMCPLANGRDCGVYDARPLTCRKLWVVDTWENCGASRDGVERPNAQVLSHPAVDGLYDRAKRVSRGLQSALEMGTSLHPLPLMVLALLEAVPDASEAPAGEAPDEKTPAE